MIVVELKVDLDRVYELRNNPEELEVYIMSLIPQKYQHSFSLISNQKYYIAEKVLKEKRFPINEKKELCKILMKGIHIVGVMNTVVSIREVERMVDTKLLLKYFRENK